MARMTFGACSYSVPSISPANWQTTNDVSEDWYVQFYYTDPEHTSKKGKFFVKKVGINHYKTAKERRIAVRAAHKAICEQLASGWNPVTESYNTLYSIEIPSETPFIRALHLAYDRLTSGESTKNNVKSMLKIITPVSVKMGMDLLPVNLIRLKHLLSILDHLRATRKKFGAPSYNHYRSYFQMLFKKLAQCGAIEVNPAREMDKTKVTKTVKHVIPAGDRKIIADYFKVNNPDYLLFLQAFYSSAARPIELLRVKHEDIYLDTGYFKKFTKKGNHYEYKLNPIPDNALPVWKILKERSKEGEYIFSKRLKPGTKLCPRDHVTRVWDYHVKGILKLPYILYDLKRTAMDEVSAIFGPEAGADKGQVSKVIAIKHYLPGETKRQDEKLKGVGGLL